MRTSKYEIFIGRQLEVNIYDALGTLLIAKGSVLLRSHLEKLEKFKIRTEEIKSAEAPAKNRNIQLEDMVKRAEKHLQGIDSCVAQNGTVPMAEVEENLLPMVQEAAQKHNLFQLLNELKEHGDYRYRQCIGTAVVATALGRRLRLGEAELKLLATASSLYDIGSLKLPSYLVNKASKLDIHETAIMRQHPRLGYELLKQSGVDERVALVALQHHEREDGSGYPNGLKGDQIDPLSKIVALADVYIAMISERPYRPAVAFFEVMDEIHQQTVQGMFDSATALTFLDSLLTSQIGCDVLLSDGRQGKIMLTNVNYPTKPLVALRGDEFINLSTSTGVAIQEIIG
ncbi:HD-GYP domain-containing protein [Paenibacillus sp. PL2-23]|uniref:HD-GYP domain-containing protein n=1 Tax=Paenibacillus sp. PL2-23 TaxID=2100729 RepID=UPI0030F518D6